MATKKNEIEQIEKFVQCRQVRIRLEDGGEELVPVPMDARENRIANQLLASRMRKAVSDTLTKYRQRDVVMTPKEIKELVEAAGRVADFSGAVYGRAEDDILRPSRASEVHVGPSEVIDLSGLAPKPSGMPEMTDSGEDQ